MHFFHEYRWWLLAGFEGLAWSATFFMLYARYGMKSSFWFKVGVVLFTVTGVIPQVTMGILNFISTRSIDWFTFVILVLIVYGFTFGKREVKKIDRWMRNKFSGQS